MKRTYEELTHDVVMRDHWLEELRAENEKLAAALQNWTRWQAAWNARGKVDAEICRERGNHASAEVIEKENEK